MSHSPAISSGASAVASADRTEPIGRRAVVSRHDPRLRRFSPMTPIALGNGNFGLTVDATGLQTFVHEHASGVPLGTMSSWAWHSSPPPSGVDPAAFAWTEMAHQGRLVPYPYTGSERWFDHAPLYAPFDGREDAGRHLFDNPHRVHLGHLGLWLPDADGRPCRSDQLTDIDQHLDLWQGLLTSSFSCAGQGVQVETCCHPALDLVSADIASPLLAAGCLGIRLSFAAADPGWLGYDKRREGHRTSIVSSGPNHLTLQRVQDADAYRVYVAWDGRAWIAQEGEHAFILRAHPGCGRLSVACHFSRDTTSVGETPAHAETTSTCAAHWRRFWGNGGVVDLAGSSDPRAVELERRTVLSQYLTATHAAGASPPQESGYVHNSWGGKFHLEVHLWHATQLALWGRLHLFERSLPWYRRIMPLAARTAARQGYAGVRWPKQIAEDGIESPCSIGPFLVWQQPHPILYAEYLYREDPRRRDLPQLAEMVEATALFMADYLQRDPRTGRYGMGPPLIPMAENHDPLRTVDPTFEISYFGLGLQLAQRWRERCGLPRCPRWDDILAHLVPLPIANGVYVAHRQAPDTFERFNRDHPSMLAAHGLVPGLGVDPETMRRTLRRAAESWDWDEAWGTDFAMAAMTAARLGETSLALDLLLMDARRHRYGPTGLCLQFDSLPAYLPANASVLAAVGMMAAGWDGCGPEPAPGFPQVGWTVRQAGLRRML